MKQIFATFFDFLVVFIILVLIFFGGPWAWALFERNFDNAVSWYQRK